MVARDEQLLVDAFATFRFFRFRIKQPDNAIGITNRRHFGIGNDDCSIGVPHGQSRAALNACRAIAYDPVEFRAQFADHFGDAVLGERILVAGL